MLREHESRPGSQLRGRAISSTRAAGMGASPEREGMPRLAPVTTAAESLVRLSPGGSKGPPPAAEGCTRLGPLDSL